MRDKLQQAYDDLDMLKALDLPVSNEKADQVSRLESQFIDEVITPMVTETLNSALKGFGKSFSLAVDFDAKQGTLTVRKTDEKRDRLASPPSLPKTRQPRTHRFANLHDKIESAENYIHDKSLGRFVMRHKVDWSFLAVGINVPVNRQAALLGALGHDFARGDSRVATFIVGDEAFKVKFVNMNQKRENQSDKIQFRFYESAFARRMQELMPELYQWIKDEKSRLGSTRTIVQEPTELTHHFSIYAMPQEDVFLIEIEKPNGEVMHQGQAEDAVHQSITSSRKVINLDEFEEYLKQQAISEGTINAYKRDICDEAIVKQIRLLTGKESMLEVTDLQVLSEIKNSISKKYRLGFTYEVINYYIKFLQSRQRI